MLLTNNFFVLFTNLVDPIILRADTTPSGGSVNGETREVVIKLWLEVKWISYADDDFNNEGHLTLSRALGKEMEWSELQGMMYIRQSLSECV
mmetsp:Transcript_5843/g.6528  ORF Transcript_5843/g.6528 Transcript_5843/m.6528 type:complete len:92 (-) Transcript_5843:519-794(-)